MEGRKKSSTDAVNLHEFEAACKLVPKNEMSTSFLLRNEVALSADSVSDLTTLEYLKTFQKAVEKGIRKEPEDGKAEREVAGDGEKREEKTRATVEDVASKKSEMAIIEKGKREEQNQKGSDSTTRLTEKQLEDPIVMEKLWDLKKIDISRDHLKNVKNLGAVPYVQYVNASHNLLEEFLDITPPVPSSMKVLDFSYNKIHSIVSLEQYWSLTQINLNHNKLTVVEGFSGLAFLQVLNLSYNEISVIRELNCPNLVTLNLSHNHFETIDEYIGCLNLRTLDLHHNRLHTVVGLKHLLELAELNISDNRIQDMSALEPLTALQNLSRLKLHVNPITTVENWRAILVNTLPQILWLDEKFVEPTEQRGSASMFQPSMEKLSLMDYSMMLLHRARQSGNIIFDSYYRNHPLPPILLIVGPPKSHCHTLALLLKQRFRIGVYLGGVHSTATTVESNHPKVDIPISNEGFQEMKNRGEFLATCHILGRVCGFASSQIARAADLGAVLVAAVPLTIAIALKSCNLYPRVVLVLPSIPPDFPQEHEREETLRRSKQENDEDEFEFQLRNLEWAGEAESNLVSEAVSQTEVVAEDEEDMPENEFETADEEDDGEADNAEQDETTDVISAEAEDVETEDQEENEEDLEEEESREEFISESEIEFKRDVETDDSSLLAKLEEPPGTEDRLSLVSKKTSKSTHKSNKALPEESDADMSLRSMIGTTPNLISSSVISEFPEGIEEEIVEQVIYPEGCNPFRWPESPSEEEDEKEFINDDLEMYEGEYGSEDGFTRGGRRKKGKVKKSKTTELPAENRLSFETFLEDEGEGNDQEPPPFLSHIEAMSVSILHTKEDYEKFHLENPGFFHAVVDTADMCESFRIVEKIAVESLEQHEPTSKIEERKRTTYGDSNPVDMKNFLSDRMSKLKGYSAMWNRGQDMRQGSVEVKAFQLKSMAESPEAFLSKPTCSTNILDTSTQRPPVTLKMRKLVELYEKRLKCSTLQRNSC